MGQIVLLALVWFIIEMLLWYLVAQFISGWWVFFWFIVAAVIGVTLIRKSMGTLNPLAQQVKAGGMMNPTMRPPESTMMKAVAMAAAGLLLLIPGLLSDLLAVLVVLPPVQKRLKDMANTYVMKNQQKMMAMMARQMGGQMGGQNPFGGMGGMGGAGGQHPFGGGGQTPFGGNSPFGNAGSPFGQNPFGNHTTTVEGTAKTIKKDAKKLTSANDD